VRVFRAGQNYYRFRVLIWCLANGATGIAVAAMSGTLWAISQRFPPRVQLGLYLLAGLILGSFLVSLVVTFLVQRLNFELRWYIVTDRSLRIRSGIWSTHELTTTFANIQEIRVSAGPLQKLLGLADVEVHSAGGGSSGPHGAQSGHVARFEGLDNANQIRDYLSDSLRRYRDSGLGEAVHEGPTSPISAAQAVLEEARQLRLSLARNSG
jgi:uncharacterized membrane protein YdbT with pleckstrin-like domain